MADVSVEFGATDVGLERALQQIQTEMGNLQGKVKSGELSMTELEQTMRRIGQVENMEKRLKAMGDASAESSPKIKKLGDDIESAGSSAQSVGGIFDAEFQKIAGAFTVGNLAAQGFQKVIDLAFDAARAVVQGFSDALDLGGRLNELSQRTGETAGKLLVLETAFKNSGLEAAQVGTAINKLQNFMQDAAKGGDKQRAAMQGLGISMADLAGKTPTEQMQIFADKIAGIEDPTERAATASEVFGDKLGGKLLPLFTDFSTNLEDARDKVGSLEEVMDENAATFDAAAETIDAVKGKMAAFAAGVLSETLPAVKNFGKALEEVDAAGLGKKIGEDLNPKIERLSFVLIGLLEALKGFKTATEDPNSFLGKFKKALEGANEAMWAFNPTLRSINGALDYFEQKGRAAAESQDKAAQSIKGTGTAAQTATTGLENVGTASETASGKVDALGTSAQATGQNIATAFSLTSDFAPKLDEISGSWSGVNEQILGGKNLLSESYNLADSMTGKIEEQTAGFGGVNEQLTTSKNLASLIDQTYGSHSEKLGEIQAKQDALAAKEETRKEKLRESLDFELAINQAKASGDAELVKTLENQKLFNAELQKAIDAGMGEPQARAFAQQMVNAKNAAAAIGNKAVTVSVTTTVDDTRWKDLLSELALNADPKAVKIALEVTGQTNLKDAYQVLQDMETVQKNFTAAFQTTGAQSIEEIRSNLAGIPTESQRQLALQITGETDLDRAVQKLDRFTGTKEAKLLLQAQGFENMDAFQNQLDGIVGEKRTNLILESLGLETVEEAKLAIDRILANDGKKASVTVEADTKTAEEKIKSLGSAPVELNLDATASIEKLKTSLAQEIDLALGSSKGSGFLEEIKGFVSEIKDLVVKIEPRLPVAALTA